MNLVWITMICLCSTTDVNILNEILKKVKDIETAADLIDFMQAVEASIENLARLLSLG